MQLLQLLQQITQETAHHDNTPNCKRDLLCTNCLVFKILFCCFITEPATVLSVTAVQVQPSDIRGGYIHQTISWRRPDNHTHITHYLIRYGAGIIKKDTEGSGLTTVNSTTSSTVLMLPKPTNHTSHSVWVAAVSQAGQGEFSDKVDFNYSSETYLK